jgi:hypothetical protein
MVDDQYLWSFVALRYPICVSPEPLSRYRQWPGSTCAKGVAANIDRDLRARHLEWLLGYAAEHYRGMDRDQLLAALRATDGNGR